MRDAALGATTRQGQTPIDRAPTLSDMDLLLTPEQVAERYGVTERTVIRWIRRGLPAVKLSNKIVRVNTRALAEWERQHEVRRQREEPEPVEVRRQ